MAISAKTRVRINLVAFVLLAIGLSYGMATQVLSVLQDRYSVYAYFPDAGGVFTNQEVTYRGITVGQVGKLEVVPEGVKIELRIDEGVRIPSEDAEARVMFKSAVGEQFVDLLPAADGAPYLQDGDEIPLERTSIPVSTQELLSTLEAVLRGVSPESLKGAIDALGIGLTGRGPDIATILESTADLADLFARRSPELESILRNGTELGDAFLASREDFEVAISELVTVSLSLSENRGNLERVFRGTNELSDEAVALIRQERAELHEALSDLADLNQLQAEHADDLSRLLTKLPTALRKVNKAFEPETGLIRFGSISEPGSAGCSYATERRRPSVRDNRLPPRNARCGNTPGAQQGASGIDGGRGVGATPSGADVLQQEPVLPSRMAGWSWSLFYLNGF